MSDDLVILVPVLRRPDRVRPFLESARRSTPSAKIIFLVDPNDHDEISAVNRSGGIPHVVVGGYARKINVGVASTKESFIFFAADDLEFVPGWFEVARSHLSDQIQVVGVNDEYPRDREHSTHFLVTRDYAGVPAIDGRRGPLSESYIHQYVDNEFIETARHRGVYEYARYSVVRHLHWTIGTMPKDETYKVGESAFGPDYAIFQERKKLWT